jgi:hypothetical protein
MDRGNFRPSASTGRGRRDLMAIGEDVEDRSDLKVPRRRVTVELCLGQEPVRRVELYLGEHSERAWHRQEVVDLVDSKRRFLPVRGAGTSAPILINREHITWLAIPLDEDRSSSEDDAAGMVELYDHRHQVTLRLTGGATLDGAILYSAPGANARLVDHLNQDGGFLALYRSDRIVLVRKAAVIEIIEGAPAEAGDPKRSG